MDGECEQVTLTATNLERARRVMSNDNLCINTHRILFLIISLNIKMTRVKVSDVQVVLKGAGRLVDAVLSKNFSITAIFAKSLIQHGKDALQTYIDSTKYHNDDKNQSKENNNDFHRNETNFTDSIDPFGFPTSSSSSSSSKSNPVVERVKYDMKEKTVPASQISRIIGFGTLGAQLAFGIAGENISNYFGSSSSSSSSQPKERISEANAELLAESLCRMRGAALKLGQMMSVQDTDGMLPPALSKALERVRQGADYMPRSQLEKELNTHLGLDWYNKYFESFDYKPIAAASIGQVHQGKLKDGTDVAVKVQYPGVAESIESDLNNLKTLITMANVVPKGVYIDQIIKVAGSELKEECNYIKEASSQMTYRSLLQKENILSKHTDVPLVYTELSTDRVMISQLVPGIALDQCVHLDQEERNAIARTMLYLTMKELFVWRFMQTDPNFANFLYDKMNQKINLIDFGAAREYSKTFVDGYMHIVWAAANEDRDTLLDQSRKLGFLTGDEPLEMINAHIEAGMVVGEPFLTDDIYDFVGSKLTQRIGKHGSTFVKHRLTPPPPEAYSLHRKLAGCFLLCIKLGAKIKCRDILQQVYDEYEFDSSHLS